MDLVCIIKKEYYDTIMVFKTRVDYGFDVTMVTVLSTFGHTDRNNWVDL